MEDEKKYFGIHGGHHSCVLFIFFICQHQMRDTQSGNHFKENPDGSGQVNIVTYCGTTL